MLALNTALMTGGVALRIGEGVILDKPIHLIQLDGVGDPASIFTRNVVVAEPGSAATMVESFGSLGPAASAQRGNGAQDRRQGRGQAHQGAA